MAIKQRNVVLVSRDVDGNTCMDMPLTCIDQVEGMDEFMASYIASQEEALAGVLNTKIMTPFLVKLVIDAATSLACPTGMIGFFALKSVPPGWLICNGSAVSRTTYAKLFSIWGTTWGEGDGATTFNLPNLDGRFLEGTTDIAKVGQYVEAGLPNIIRTEVNFQIAIYFQIASVIERNDALTFHGDAFISNIKRTVAN